MGITIRETVVKIQENTCQASLHGLTAKPAASFAPWMHITNQHSGSAYYWQHQHHLQQSALEFKTHDPQQSAASLPSIHKKQAIYSPVLPSKQVSVQTDQAPASSLKKMPDNTVGFPALLTKIPTIKNAYPPFTKQTCKPPIFLYKNHKTIKQTMRTKRPFPLFKKHRIFQEKDQLQISINWPDFHKKPIFQRSLQQLTNWFLQQGLTIKKWMINGVIQ